MTRLDEAIKDLAYILDVLMDYRTIIESGDCNTCKNEFCNWKPQAGSLTRYNCPHYRGDKNER